MKDIPAFPHSFVRHPTEETYITKGMTLRDYFAAQAMQGFMSGCATRGEVVIYSNLAGLSYEMADAMMEAREA